MKRINISARCPVAQCGLAVMLLAGLGPLISRQGAFGRFTEMTPDSPHEILDY